MSVDFQGLAAKGFQGLKVTGWYTKTLALNLLRRGLILGRYTLACWQKQKLIRPCAVWASNSFRPWNRARPTRWW